MIKVDQFYVDENTVISIREVSTFCIMIKLQTLTLNRFHHLYLSLQICVIIMTN